MDVLVNQLGYDPESEKRAVVATEGGGEIDGYRVVDAADGSVVATGDPTPVGGVANWRDWEFWTIDFSRVRERGEYVVAVEAGDERVHSRRFEVADRIVQERVLSDVLFHLKSQRCSGRYDRADRAVPFVGDRADEVDVHGGWYDASGDTSKYLSHLSYANYLNPQQTPLVVWGVIDAYETLLDRHGESGAGTDAGSPTGPLGAELAERFVEEALHGADFLVRMLDDEGYFYTTVFDGWSHRTDRREICSFETMAGAKYDDYEAGYRQGGGVAIAALARASSLVAPDSAPRDLLSGAADYEPEAYLAGAVTAFEHLEANNEAYLDDGTENVIDDYCALLAATELFAATGQDRFRGTAVERARSLLDRQTGDDRYEGWFRADEDGERPYFHAADEGLPILALCRFLAVDEETSTDGGGGGADGEAATGDGSSIAADVRSCIERYWQFELEITDEVTNPFGYARQYVKAVDEDAPRPAFFMPHENETGYWWQGENARIASLAAAAFRSRQYVANTELGGRLESFARAQLDWILGLNPFDVAMVRGVGPQEPEYHRARRNAPGGILNGVTAGVDDEEDIAFCPEPDASDHRNRWRWAEQWLPHAAWFVVAACADDRV